MLDGSEPAPTSNIVNSCALGEHGFVLVPVNVTNGLTLAFSYASPSPGIRDPNLGIPVQPTPSDTAREFLGPDGHIFDFTFGDPPEEPSKLNITMTVSAGGSNATVTCGPIDYNPVFRLLDASGKYQVKLGATLDLTAENNTTIGTVTLSPQGLTAQVTGSTMTLTCDPAAPLGPHTVLCDVQGDPTKLSRRTIEVIP